jgi:hypothetical protein
MNIKRIQELAEECGIDMFNESEGDFFEGSVESLKLFAEKVIGDYENNPEDDIGQIDEKEANEQYCFTSYGKKEDWE